MIELNPLEARVVGALIEKEITTPDQYPLSIKALAVACNQKSNREPVMDLDEEEVQNIVDALIKRNLAFEIRFGGRVAKYKHRFCNTEFSKMHFDAKELGVLCVMLLRGPQTPGELRSRTNRLSEFVDVQDVERTLQKLMSREDGPFVVRLDREPGKRESRYAHLFSGEVPIEISLPPSSGAVLNSPEEESSHEERIETLENELAALRKEFDLLKAQWDELNS